MVASISCRSQGGAGEPPRQARSGARVLPLPVTALASRESMEGKAFPRISPDSPGAGRADFPARDGARPALILTWPL